MLRTETKIIYPQMVTFEGVKGVQKAKGLAIVHHSDFIDFYPITDKDVIGAANIKVPISDLKVLDDVINRLIEIKDLRLAELKGIQKGILKEEKEEVIKEPEVKEQEQGTPFDEKLPE